MSLSLLDFHRANLRRNNESFFNGEPWSLLEWAGCLAGETGELANTIKKMKREESRLPPTIDPYDVAIPPDLTTEEEDELWAEVLGDAVAAACERDCVPLHGEYLRAATDWVRLRREAIREFGDVLTYLDVLSHKIGNGPLDRAVVDKFNEVSDRVGSEVRL